MKRDKLTGWSRILVETQHEVHWINTHGTLACTPTDHQNIVKLTPLVLLSSYEVNVNEVCVDCINLVDQVLGDEMEALLIASD